VRSKIEDRPRANLVEKSLQRPAVFEIETYDFLRIYTFKSPRVLVRNTDYVISHTEEMPQEVCADETTCPCDEDWTF
jgi:hypothetical protein